MRKNEKVYVAMAKAGINQSKLSEILQKDPPTISKLLNGVEWDISEQEEVIEKIEAYAASIEGR